MGIPHVQLGDGTQVIDIRDTTATPADVAQGKVFYSANGDRAVGAAAPGSGGGSAPTCTVVGADYGDYGTATGTVRYMTADGHKYSDWGPGTDLGGVLCNSFLSFRITDNTTTVDGGQLLETNGKQHLVAIQGTNGGTVTIDIY